MIYMTGVSNGSINDTVSSVSKRWGGRFKVEIIQDWKSLAKLGKRKVAKWLTLQCMASILMISLKGCAKKTSLLVIIGAEKVPQEAHDLADYNIAIGNQPHSEIRIGNFSRQDIHR